jgi:hypothetical protein
MVRGAPLAILIFVALALILTGCDLVLAIFSMSPFPGYLSQAVDVVDMRSEVVEFLGDDDLRWESDVHVLRNSISEHVFLVVRKDPGGQIVYAFDTSLNLEASETVMYHSRIHLVEAVTEDFVVGDVRFSEPSVPGDPLVASSPYPSLGMDLWDKQMFAHASGNYIAWSSFDQLYCDQYDDGWAYLNGGSVIILGGEELKLLGLGYEPVLADPILGTGITPVYLFVHGWDRDGGREYGFLYVIRTSADDYPNLGSTVTADLVNDGLPTGRTSGRIRNVDDDHPVFYTRKGVVAQTRMRGTFQLLQLNGERIKSFYVTSDEEASFDFDIDGQYYYLFDQQTLRLYKAETGF